LQGNSNSTAHLGTVELARLLEESRQPGGAALEAASVHAHLESCSSCREQFEQLVSFDRQLQAFRVNPALPSSAPDDCPGSAVWRQIVGGPAPPEQTLSFLKHASQCDHCGPLLREALTEAVHLNQELTEAERARITSLESASPAWQQQLARRIAGTQEPFSALYSSPKRQESWGHASWRQKWLSVPRLAMAGASLLLVLGMGLRLALHQPLYQSLFHRDQAAAATELLARAYTEKRTLELRFVGAAYGPQRISRGPATSFADRPTTLSKAEALIASQLESHPSDPAWLQAKGEADLLDGRYDPAVDTLRHALQLDPDSPAILIDLATAYSQRALQEGRNEDFASAYEHLSQVLRLRADDPVALFNRAIVAEHQFLYHQALEDWEHYLRLDQSSQWAQEARIRAEAVRERLKEHQGQAKPLLTPAEVTASLSDADPAGKVEPRIDEYLDQAVVTWLPQAFPGVKADEGLGHGASGNRDAAKQALFFLAEVTSRQHRDQWLTDLLRGSSAPHFPQAIAELVRAVRANETGDYNVSRQQATLAEKLFRASGNAAGALRAQFEQTFAAQLTRHGQECQRQAIAAGAVSKRYSYAWLQIQFGLDQGVCSGLLGDLGNYEKAARLAQDRAQQAGYGALYLRAVGFVADSRLATGDREGDWKLVCDGLQRYWPGQFPAVRGYNLYQEGALAAEDAGQSSLQLAFWREAVALIDSDDEALLWRGMAHSFMANAAAAAGLPELAEQQYAEAARLFAATPRTQASRDDALETAIRIARLEAHQGRFDDAIARLTAIQDQVRALTNNYLAQNFYSALGEVQLRSHHEADAERAFRAALGYAEQNLSSLTSETDRMGWSKSAKPAYLGLAEAELVQGHEQESLDVFEWYLGAPQRAGVFSRASPRHVPEPLLALSDPSQLPFQPSIQSHETVLAYGVLPDGFAIWVEDNGSVTAKWFPQSAQELQDLAANFYSQCSDPGSEWSALRRNGQALYSLLIAPVEQSLNPEHTLVIETEGFLARLPFEALVDASGHYLIERVPIIHSPGPYAEARMHPDATISGDSPALVVGSAASSADAGLLPDPNVPLGADALARSFRSPSVLKGPDATLSAVRKALPAAAIFHFAGHAVTISNHSGLMLQGRKGEAAPPVLLDASVVRNLNLRNMQLAVLAACSTDSGERGTRGFDSVAEALQSSGVPHVVASRWTVDSVQADTFSDFFYRSLLSGQTVSNATRLTAQKMLSNSRSAHPYYWAAFAAYGRP
jgi:CHAT domain-containing protein/cytochrome c-type biogenesis protein CcmH/NrfG